MYGQQINRSAIMKMHIGYGGKYVAIYNRPLDEAKESDRVCRFPRTSETEHLARAMVAGPELLALAERVARLNRDAGEIGAGMLASLVDEARLLVAKTNDA
jgi:hypothetical protein